MERHSVRRLLINYSIAFCIILLLTFALPRLMPGDPVTAIYGELQEEGIELTPELEAAINARYGLDKPIWVQFFDYFTSLLKADFGYSFIFDEPVSDLIFGHIPWTLLLLGSALLLSKLIAIVLGIESGWRRGKKSDKVMLAGLMAFEGCPNFVVGLVFLIIFGVILGIAPLYGAENANLNLSGIPRLCDVLKHLILPLSALIMTSITGSYLLMRNTMITTLNEPFILNARAKGLKDRKIRYNHAGRNAILPMVTAIGMSFGMLITGSMFIEMIFAYPGVGTLLYESIMRRDYFTLQGIFFILTIFVLAANLTVDLLYKKIDPRIEDAR
jgi:peptide/nickel transport system permease protein